MADPKQKPVDQTEEDKKAKPKEKSTFEKVVDIMHGLTQPGSGNGQEMADTLLKRAQQDREKKAGLDES